MTLTEHQKYIIGKILKSEDPIVNLSVLIQNTKLTKDALEYLKSNVLDLGYELNGNDQTQGLTNCGYFPESCRTPDPFYEEPDTCRMPSPGCCFIPKKEEVVGKHEGRSKR